jgi:hypothetical protein
MKKISLTLVLIFGLTLMAWAESDEALTEQAMQSVQQRTEEMSRQGVPKAKAEKMLTQMLLNRFREENIVRAERIVMQNVQDGLPVDPVMSKAMEGMAKRMADDKTLVAMEQVRNRQMFSHQLARKLSNDPKTVTAIADTAYDALTARMQEKDMTRITARLEGWARQKTRNESEIMALQTMETVRTMARLGARSPDVSETACQALRHNYTARQMSQIRTNFMAQAQKKDPEPLGKQYAGTIGKSGGVSSDSGRGTGYSGGGSGSSGSSGSSGGSGGSGSSGSSGSGLRWLRRLRLRQLRQLRWLRRLRRLRRLRWLRQLRRLRRLRQLRRFRRFRRFRRLGRLGRLRRWKIMKPEMGPQVRALLT